MDFTKEDRKLIVEHDVKIGMVCKDIKTLSTDMKDGFAKIFDKLDANIVGCSDNRTSCRKEIDEKINRFFTKRVLMWILAFIIVGLIGIGTYTGELSSKVQLNIHRINTIVHGGE